MPSQTIEIGQRTDTGPVRDHNEDSILATRVDSDLSRDEVVLAVADGVGGHAQGEVASAIAVKTVFEVLIGAPVHAIGAETLEETIRLANTRINALAEGGYAAPATTMTVCWATDSEYIVGHVGDSRAYLLSKTVVQLTDDDSHVAEAVRRGLMTQEDARRSPLRNQLTKSVGTRQEVRPELQDGSWAYGDVLLLCSDGLSEYLDGDEMLRIVHDSDDLQDACDRMVSLAAQRGGHDNISVVAARNLARSDGARPATGPIKAPAKKSKGFSPLGVRSLSFAIIAVACALIALGIWNARVPKPKPTLGSAVTETPQRPHLFVKLMPGGILRLNASDDYRVRVPNLPLSAKRPVELALKATDAAKSGEPKDTSIELLDSDGKSVAKSDPGKPIQIDVDPDRLMSIQFVGPDGGPIWQPVEVEISKPQVKQ